MYRVPEARLWLNPEEAVKIAISELKGAEGY